MFDGYFTPVPLPPAHTNEHHILSHLYKYVIFRLTLTFCPDPHHQILQVEFSMAMDSSVQLLLTHMETSPVLPVFVYVIDYISLICTYCTLTIK